MQTFIVVKDSVKRYHIYDTIGNCVAVVKSVSSLYKYFEAVIVTSDYPQFIQRFTAVDDTFIVILK